MHTSALEAQVTDVCTVHQTGFIVGINCVRTRQEISKHISIAYTVVLDYAHICRINIYVCVDVFIHSHIRLKSCTCL